MGNRIFNTGGIPTRNTVFDVNRDKLLVISDLPGNQDNHYLIDVDSIGSGAGVYIPLTSKGIPNGVATLDATGKVPLSQLPASITSGAAIDDLVVSGITTWSSTKIDLELNGKASTTHASTHEIGGSDVLNWKELAGSYAPTNYTLLTSPSVTTGTLGQQIFSIDAKLATAGQVTYTETITISGVQASSKQFTTSNNITSTSSIIFLPQGGTAQFYGDDYTVVGSNVISWNGLGLDGILASGDKIFISYR